MTTNLSLFFSVIFVVLGALILLPAIWNMHKVTQKMPFKNLKPAWRLLNVLAVFFCLVFSVAAYAIIKQDLVFLEWLISISFFFAGIYVLSMSAIISKTVDELRNSEQRNKHMIEEVQDYAIILLDVNGKVLSWNQGAQKIKGYTASEIIGKSFANFYMPEDFAQNKPEQLLKIALQEGRAKDEGYRLRKDGTRFWGTVAITALYNDKGAVIGFSKVTRDFTDRKNAEDKIQLLNESLEQTVRERTAELLETNKELNTFAYTIAHDLQAPLRGLSSFAGFLLKKNSHQLDADAQESLRYIDTSAKRMSKLITALLDFSKLGKEAVNKSWSDMALLAYEIKQTVAYNSNSQITINELPRAYCDPVLIGQVWQNLIGNAVKYSTLKPNPLIEVGARTMEGKVVYFVKDNGAGFDMKYAENLFGVFKRMHSDEEFEGTGIGLATAHRIITKHGGKIWAEATKGEGACFYFSLGSDAEKQHV